SEKSPEEIIIIKREQEEKKQEPTYTIKSTAKNTPKKFELKHALMEALIEDENAMDKEVVDTGKSTKKRRTRESESAKKPSTTKESSKDKDPKILGLLWLLRVYDFHGLCCCTKSGYELLLSGRSGLGLTVIPLIDLPEVDNNWANSFAKAHQDPDENKLHNKIDDIGPFIRWYCRMLDIRKRLGHPVYFTVYYSS
ncbi:hypothetical protein Tco_1180586, partial [Tanacetum coccineum]